MGIPIIGDIINAVKDLAGEVIVDKDKKNQIEFELEKLRIEADERFHEELMGQIEVNKIEAQNPSLFVAGWRPAVGWVCVAGLGWTFVLSPFAEMMAGWFGYVGQMPLTDTETLLVLVTGMLGLGAQRSFEKLRGVQTDIVSKVKK